MGIVNVTPDSFSDGGRYLQVDSAVRHGLRLLNQGADIVDVGGESTRPGAERVSTREELARVIPVVRELVAAGAVVSIDTMRSSVAEAAVGEGAALVNDVSGGLADPAMASCVANLRVPYVAAHWRAHSATMHSYARYHDVAVDVVGELRARVDDLVAHGVEPDCIIVDPGLGFAKTAEQSWRLLSRLEVLRELGRPVLVGASRKSFLGRLGQPDDGPDAASRDAATAAVTAIAAACGTFAVRVHDVAGSVIAARVAAALRTSG
jgi:dihydropteroate synthase